MTDSFYYSFILQTATLIVAVYIAARQIKTSINHAARAIENQKIIVKPNKAIPIYGTGFENLAITL